MSKSVITLGLVIISTSLASSIRYAGMDCRLQLYQVGDSCVRIRIAGPQPDKHHTSSTVLVDFEQRQILDVRQLSGNLMLKAGRLDLTLSNEDGLAVAIRLGSRCVQELIFYDDPNGSLQFRTDAAVLGLGEGAKQFDRRGAFYPMQASWGGWDRPLLGSVVPSPFLMGTDGWAMFVHQPQGQFDLRSNPARFIPSDTSCLDMFVIGLTKPADALSYYIMITGRPVMPPRWALGYLQSHRTLQGPDEILAIAKGFRERGLPCDGLIYLGTGYCPNGWNTGHGSLTFNPKAFDRPKDIIDQLHAMGFKVILHVNRPPRDLFGVSIGDRSDEPSHISGYWARHKETFGLGIDGFWPDDGDELSIESRLARHRCYYQGPLQDRPSERPWSLHRTGYSGCQRYGGWIWSGDIDSTWATLSWQIAVGLNHSLSLTPFWGTDTGGFYPTEQLTGELYIRWFQFSAFCPLFRSHGRTWHLRLPWGWNTGQSGPVEHNRGPVTSELKNPDVEPICKQYLELRYRLLPYNYSIARRVCDTGMPMMRAMWLHYPDDQHARDLSDQYMWGTSLLIAPVVKKGSGTRRLYLPSGLWYDWWTRQPLTGGRWIERQVDLATMPIYVMGGSVIPLGPVLQYTGQPVTEPITLLVFPGSDGGFLMYDDDGHGTGYLDGTDPNAFWLDLVWEDKIRCLTIRPSERTKTWSRRPIVFQAEIAGSDLKNQVQFDGRPSQVRF